MGLACVRFTVRRMMLASAILASHLVRFRGNHGDRYISISND